MGVSRYLQSKVMHALIEKYGDHHFKYHFGSFLILIGNRGTRITDLAEQLSISKQAVNQAINQIEAAGYLRRQPDPYDGRAKLVVLTDGGEQLLQLGASLMADIESEFASLIGSIRVQRLTENLAALYTGLAFAEPVQRQQGTGLGWLLPRVHQETMRRLMELTGSRGHVDLKMRYVQVLSFMGPQGGRIQYMARVNEVSKQAIGAIANDLEERGYLYRETDAEDGRQVLLKLTADGMRLIEDSVGSITELEYQFTQKIGQTAMQEMKADLLMLYEGLQIESGLFTNVSSGRDKLLTMAVRLLQQLGTDDARTLADILLNISDVDS
jgi:DNA-binding MarR family transcriptional regulator